MRFQNRIRCSSCGAKAHVFVNHDGRTYEDCPSCHRSALIPIREPTAADVPMTKWDRRKKFSRDNATVRQPRRP